MTGLNAVGHASGPGIRPLSVTSAGDVHVAQRLYLVCASVEVALAERERLPQSCQARHAALQTSVRIMVDECIDNAVDARAVSQRGFARCARLLDEISRVHQEASIAVAVAKAAGAARSRSTG